MRALSYLLSALVIAALAASVFEAGFLDAPGGLAELLRRQLFLVAPTCLVYGALKAHLRRDHSDGVWAAEAGALAWALGSTQAVVLARMNLAASAAALLFLAHLLSLEGHRQRGPRFFLGAGLAGGLALLTHPPIALPLGVVGLHAIFGGTRHLPRPRFEALSGRAMAGLAGIALAFVAGLSLGMTWPTLLWAEPLAAATPFAAPEPTRLLTALVGPPFREGLLLQTPWLLLAFLGLGLWWRRGTRRPLLGVALSVLTASLITTAVTGGAPALALLPALPFLAGPTTRLLSSLRERPGRQGPRAAGLGLGFALAGVTGIALSPVLALVRADSRPSLPMLIAGGGAIASGVLLALLLPGRASRRGRLESLALAGLLAVAIALLLAFFGDALPGGSPDL